MLRRALVWAGVVSFVSVAAGCSASESEEGSGAARVIVRERPDASPVTNSTDAAAPMPLAATFGTITEGFDRAQYGYEAPDKGPRGLYVELHAGGDPACPTQDAPSPSRTVILTGVREGSAVQTEADGVTATLLDFTGKLGAGVHVSSTAAKVVPIAGSKATFDVTLTFGADQVIRGRVDATHCDSLDAISE
jgi:hypothetical protein